jgi:hypothetical protein
MSAGTANAGDARILCTMTQRAVRCSSLLACVSAMVLPAWNAISARQPAEKTVFATAVATAAGPIRDLSAKDFVVHEANGTDEVIASELATDPLSILILVDTTQPSIGMSPPTLDLRTGLQTFVKLIRAGNPGAQIALTEIAGAAVPRTSFGAPAADLDTAIQRLNPNVQSTGVLLEALSDASRTIAQRPIPRRVIVTIDFASHDTSADTTLRKVPDEVHRSGASVWAVSVRGGETVAREAILNAVTQNSGGLRLSIVAPTGLENQLKIVANSLLSQYSITFARTNTGGVKGLKIETTRGGKVLPTVFMR